jgi:phosphoribosylformylglycinamidine synthase I
MKKKRAGVLRFPGTNCDQDMFDALKAVGFESTWCWHKDTFKPEDFDFFVVPGGFSYGDYLRSGALASHSAAMNSLREAASQGRPILGVCNGFQILCESQLLPGALLRNEAGRFIDQWVDLNWELRGSLWGYTGRERLRFPIAHGEGRFFATPDTLAEMRERDQIWLTYVEPVNGAVENIAGVLNANRNVAGLMPHPERAIASYLGGTDGRQFFEGVLSALE